LELLWQVQALLLLAQVLPLQALPGMHLFPLRLHHKHFHLR
jgi:hypothetical protein